MVPKVERTPGTVERERRRNVQNLVDLRMLGLRQATAGIGGERLQVAARPFRIEHAQRERTLARPRHAGDAHELSQRDIDIDIFQVMHARPAHLDRIWLSLHRYRSPS